MTATTQDRLAVQTYRIFVKATAEEVWDALTRPGWTRKYGFLDGAPRAADLVAGRDAGLAGWTWIRSELKSLLETGRPLAA